MTDKDPNDFGPYAGYLQSRVWPSWNHRTGELTHTEVTFDSMPPQYAAAALAKLVRWARIAPEGEIAQYPDEDSREYEVRTSELGKCLAARAVNMEPDTFFALYGEFGVGDPADEREVVAELAVSLGDNGLDWTLQQRLVLAMNLLETIAERWRCVEKFS